MSGFLKSCFVVIIGFSVSAARGNSCTDFSGRWSGPCTFDATGKADGGLETTIVQSGCTSFQGHDFGEHWNLNKQIPNGTEVDSGFLGWDANKSSVFIDENFDVKYSASERVVRFSEVYTMSGATLILKSSQSTDVIQNGVHNFNPGASITCKLVKVP